MIADVFFEHATYADIPHKFEAGTPAIAEAIALGAAVDYLSQWGMERIHAYEQELTAYLFERLQELPASQCMAPNRAIALPWPALPLVRCIPTISRPSLISRGLPSAQDTTAHSPCTAI